MSAERLEKTQKEGVRLQAAWWAGVLLVIAAGIWLRLYDLSADPPLGMTWSHAPYTDGARIVDGARSKILWGVWETDPAAPILLYYPLSSVLAYVVFTVFGVGLWQANLTGALPGVGALVLVMALGRTRNVAVSLLAGLIVSVNFFLVAYSRLPMCEPLMILVMLLVPWLLMRRTLRPWHSAGAGLALAAAAFFVKFHALVLLPVTAVWMAAFRGGPDSVEGDGGGRRHTGLFLAGFGLGMLVWVVAILVPHSGVVGDFLEHNLIAQYGKSDAPGSPGGIPGFLEDRWFGLVGSGTNVRFFGRMPLVALLAVLTGLSFASNWRVRRGRAWWLESYFALWFAGGVAALALLDYRPLRYHLQLVPPAAILAALALNRVLQGPSDERAPGKRAYLPCLFIFSVFIVFQALIEVPVYMSKHPVGSQHFLSALGMDPRSVFMGLSKLVNSPWLVSLLSAVVALLVSGLVAWRRGPGNPGERRRLSPWVRGAGVLVLIGLILWIDGALHRGGWADRRHSLRDVSRDLGQVLGPDAFLVGTAATTVSLENRLKTLPAYGRIIKQKDVERFRGYPITHFLLRDGPLSEFLEAEFPAVSDSLVFLRKYVIGPAESGLYRVLGWPGSQEYVPTDFEQGVGELDAGNWREAEDGLRDFLETRPGNAGAWLALGIALEQQGRGAEALETVGRAVSLAPDDLALLNDAGAALARYGRLTEAAGVWSRVLKLNPGDLRARTYLEALQRNLQRTGEARP